MTITAKVLIAAKQAENVQTAQYTAVNCKSRVDKFTATNTSANNVTLSINIVPSGGTASAGNIVLSLRAIAPGETYTCPEMIGQILESGMFISTLASAASALTIRSSGIEIT